MKSQLSLKNLEKARALDVPKRDKVLRRADEVKAFWYENKNLLINAWEEWEKNEPIEASLSPLSIVDKNLRERIEETWRNPEKESQVKELLEKVSPGVYEFQFFDPEKIIRLRQYLDKVEQSQIPLRPPYGIVLNRKGAMLDRRSEGYLAAPSFQSLYQDILDRYMRPIARLLFPEIMGYDRQTFGFSIQYQPEKDTSIRMHTDASSVTLNINLNLPDEPFEGSELDFHNPDGKNNRVSFKPGAAIIHRGNVAHAALPITSGTRTNLVLWLYGDEMQTPRYNIADVGVLPEERWAIPTNELDQHAPF